MANITPVTTRASDPGVQDVFVTQWTMGNADTGLPLQMSGAADRSVQITGTIGGATWFLEGSNDGTNYSTLQDPIGTDLTGINTGVPALYQILELTRYVRPRTTGGTTTAIVVTVLARGQRG